MPDLEQLREWVIKANALASVVVETQAMVAEARIRQQLAKEDSKLAERYKAEYIYTKRQYQLAMAMLQDATGTDSAEGAASRLLDVRVAHSSTMELYENLRKVKFLAEVLRACGGVGDDGTTIDEVERKVVALETEYAVAFRDTLTLIPESELSRLTL